MGNQVARDRASDESSAPAVAKVCHPPTQHSTSNSASARSSRDGGSRLHGISDLQQLGPLGAAALHQVATGEHCQPGAAAGTAGSLKDSARSMDLGTGCGAAGAPCPPSPPPPASLAHMAASASGVFSPTSSTASLVAAVATPRTSLSGALPSDGPAAATAVRLATPPSMGAPTGPQPPDHQGVAGLLGAALAAAAAEEKLRVRRVSFDERQGSPPLPPPGGRRSSLGSRPPRAPPPQPQQPSSPQRSGGPSGARVSLDSNCSARSGRSSFVLEALAGEGGGGGGGSGAGAAKFYGRASMHVQPLADDKRSTGRVFESALPEDLVFMYRRLAPLLPGAPVPLGALAHAWRCPLDEAAEAAHIFELQGVLRLSLVQPGQAWVLVAPDHLHYLTAVHRHHLTSLHSDIIDAYTCQGSMSPGVVPNDGYWLLAVCHHLAGAGRLAELRQLLSNPGWLELKLHTYGVSALVEDFRRYLQLQQDPLVKLVLQAFQMSLSVCMERGHLPLLRRQVVLRMVAAAAAEAAPGDGSLSRSTSNVTVSSATPPQRLSHGSASSGGGAAAERAEWFARQVEACRAEAEAVGGAGRPRHLLARTASLQQAGGQHRMALRGHAGPVRKVAISPDGCDVLTASDDGSVQVWDMDIGDCVMQLRHTPAGSPGPQAPVTALAVTSSGAVCVVGDATGAVAWFDLRSGALLSVTQAHADRVVAVAQDSCGDRLLSAAADGSLLLWCVHQQAVEAVLSGQRSSNGGGSSSAFLDATMSEDGALAATGGEDFNVRIWDLDARQLRAVLGGHAGWVVSVQFIPTRTSSQALEPPGRWLVSASADATARIWDVTAATCVHVLAGHTGRVNAVRASRAGDRVATVSDDRTARVWDTASGACISVLRGHGSWLNDVAFFRNGTRAVTVGADHLVTVWDVGSGRCEAMLEGHSGEVKAVAVTRGGRFAVTASMDGSAQVWDLAASALVLAGRHAGKVRAVAIAPGGAVAASVGVDGRLRLWSLPDGRCSYSGAAHAAAPPLALAAAAAAADGSPLFLTAGGDRRVVSWRVSGGGSGGADGHGDAGHDACEAKAQPVVLLPEQQGSRTKCVAFSADGRRAIVLLFDSTVAVWELDGGDGGDSGGGGSSGGSPRLLCQLIKRGERDPMRTHAGGVSGACLSRCGSTAVTVSKDGTARVWDAASGACRHMLQGHRDGIHAAVLGGPCDALLVTASLDGTARVWSVRSGGCIAVLRHATPVTLVSLSHDGLRVVTAGEGAHAWLWDLPSGALLATLAEQRSQVNAAAFSDDSSLLALASDDATITLWAAAAPQLVGLFVGDAAMTAVAFASPAPPPLPGAGLSSLRLHVPPPAPPPHTIVAGDAGGAVHVLECPSLAAVVPAWGLSPTAAAALRPSAF